MQHISGDIRVELDETRQHPVDVEQNLIDLKRRLGLDGMSWHINKLDAVVQVSLPPLARDHFKYVMDELQRLT